MRGQRGGILFIIVIVAAIALVIYLYTTQEDTRSSTVFKDRQDDPEEAMKLYLETAYHFMHNEPRGGFEDVKLVVVEEDWEWFQENYESMHQDTFALGSAIDPNAAGAVARRGALNNLFGVGPNRADAEVIDRAFGDDETTFTLRYLAGQDFNGENVMAVGKVGLVKVGKLWKVRDFGGGRSYFERGGY